MLDRPETVARPFPNSRLVALALAATAWLALVAEWAASGPLPDWLREIGFSAALLAAAAGAYRLRNAATPVRRGALTLLYAVSWQ